MWQQNPIASALFIDTSTHTHTYASRAPHLLLLLRGQPRESREHTQTKELHDVLDGGIIFFSSLSLFSYFLPSCINEETLWNNIVSRREKEKKYKILSSAPIYAKLHFQLLTGL